MIEIPKEEVGKMKRKSMVLGIASLAAILLFAAIAPQALRAKGPPQIPFVGMSLTYYANALGNFVPRPVTVLKYYPETNSVLIRDAADYMLVYVENREAYWATGWYETQVPFAVEYWIPTDIKIGSHVKIYQHEAEVIGSAVLSVEGKSVDCWQLYAAWDDWQVTSYYEKITGLWIAASGVLWDENGTPAWEWVGHLASTDVAL